MAVLSVVIPAEIPAENVDLLNLSEPFAAIDLEQCPKGHKNGWSGIRSNKVEDGEVPVGAETVAHQYNDNAD